jgi:hypothetical protein
LVALYQIPVPEAFHMKTDGQLFDFSAKDDNICIALLRMTEGTTIGPALNDVDTNPPVNAVVSLIGTKASVKVLSSSTLTSPYLSHSFPPLSL